MPKDNPYCKHIQDGRLLYLGYNGPETEYCCWDEVEFGDINRADKLPLMTKELLALMLDAEPCLTMTVNGIPIPRSTTQYPWLG